MFSKLSARLINHPRTKRFLWFWPLWVAIGAVILTVVSIIVAANISIKAQNTAISKVVNSLVIPANWSEMPGGITPAQTPCLGGNPCPSAFLRWDTNNTVSTSQVESILKSAGLPPKVNGDCNPNRADIYWPTSLCSAVGSRDGFDVALDVSANKSSHRVFLVVEIRPQR